MESSGISLDGLGSILAVIVSLIALLGTMFSNKKQLNDSLDSKSGWRKELFDVASKEEISIGDLQRIRSALRIFKHNHRLVKYSFDWMTNFMIIVLDCFIESSKEEKNTQSVPILQNNIDLYTKKNVFGIMVESRKTEGTFVSQGQLNDYVCPGYIQDITRIFARYLLKNHWDYNLTMMPNNAILKRFHTNKAQKIAKQTFLQVMKLIIEEDSLMAKDNREELIKKLNIFIDEKESKETYIKNWKWALIPILGLLATFGLTIFWFFDVSDLKTRRSVLVFLLILSVLSFFIIKYFLKAEKK
ncbi:hypothetical protein [Enterococcus sp.]|uniref:hypothetical protein n=1 Tax=Enterococcus sp. TaxID=35783 RepID=UPI002FC5EE1B